MEKFRILVKGIVKYQDKFLIVEKWYDDRIVDPYQWEFIDGRLEFGEEPEKGVVRLVKEHTGLDVKVSHALYTWSFMVGEIWNIGISYLCTTNYNEIILSEELNDYKWINQDVFGDYIENKNILEDISKIDL